MVQAIGAMSVQRATSKKSQTHIFSVLHQSMYSFKVNVLVYFKMKVQCFTKVNFTNKQTEDNTNKTSVISTDRT